jgi:hypothetical protein
VNLRVTARIHRRILAPRPRAGSRSTLAGVRRVPRS